MEKREVENSYLKLNWKTIKWLFLAGFLPPMYFQLSYLVKHNFLKLQSIQSFLLWTLISVITVVSLTILVFQEIKVINRHLPWKERPGLRILVELFIANITVLPAMALLAKFTHKWHCLSSIGKVTYTDHLFQELTIGLIMLTILLTVVEGSYFFREWKASLVLAEKLKKESMQAQLESLKNQVNPHFLFNSLNVLSNLVHKDADRAEEFIDQFASVYRYVLNIQDKTAVTLGEELGFIDAYVFLQKIRFQEGFDVEIDINKECYGHYVVPLSLQMLVENAIKHNVVSEEEPLKINIFLEDDRVNVVNKINLRTDENKSVGMGLKNLRQRYYLLAGIMPEIKEEDNTFIANIPLIKPEDNSDIEYESECCNHRRRKIRS